MRLLWVLAVVGAWLSLAATLLAAMRHSMLGWLFAAGMVVCYLIMWVTDPRPRKPSKLVRTLEDYQRAESDRLWAEFDHGEAHEMEWDG